MPRCLCLLAAIMVPFIAAMNYYFEELFETSQFGSTEPRAVKRQLLPQHPFSSDEFRCAPKYRGRVVTCTTIFRLWSTTFLSLSVQKQNTKKAFLENDEHFIYSVGVKCMFEMVELLVVSCHQRMIYWWSCIMARCLCCGTVNLDMGRGWGWRTNRNQNGNKPNTTLWPSLSEHKDKLVPPQPSEESLDTNFLAAENPNPVPGNLNLALGDLNPRTRGTWILR